MRADAQAWEVRRRRTVFTGGPNLEVAVEDVRLPDGRELDDYYHVRLADFAVVFATMEGGEVLVMRQYKHGPRRVCLAFPGGALSAGETAVDAARRELLEETGCVSEQWSSYGAYVTNGNQYCATAYLFRADQCRQVSEPTGADIEAPELLMYSAADLLRPEMLGQFVLTSHIALLAMATHPHVPFTAAV
jgi:ADP-ribose pyrophosphatase